MSKRLVLGWVLLGASIIGWPISQFTWARNEPPTVLALSWIAIILTALNVLLTEEVKEGD